MSGSAARAPAVGFDIGGSKTEVVVLEEGCTPEGPHAGAEIHRRRQPTPQHYEGLLEMLCAMLRDAEHTAGMSCTVGIGAPGSPNPATGLHRNSNLRCLNGRPFAADAARALGRSVRVANDANCMALSEATDGAGRGARVVFGVIIGTGVGGGIVVDGAVVEGANGIAGEWGHIPMPGVSDSERLGAACYCGRTGCVEQFLSGPAMQRRFGEEWADSPGAREWYSDHLAETLGVVVNLLDPGAIVLAGGLSNLPGLPAQVQERLAKHAFTDHCVTRIARAVHGDSSGVRGAAWLGSKDSRSDRATGGDA